MLQLNVVFVPMSQPSKKPKADFNALEKENILWCLWFW